MRTATAVHDAASDQAQRQTALLRADETGEREVLISVAAATAPAGGFSAGYPQQSPDLAPIPPCRAAWRILTGATVSRR